MGLIMAFAISLLQITHVRNHINAFNRGTRAIHSLKDEHLMYLQLFHKYVGKNLKYNAYFQHF
uniref:Uncharacterized protein n=1 Tax=Anguilla anguilla TaxID=7936 RepID=A0A0E9PUS2_ANGAN